MEQDRRILYTAISHKGGSTDASSNLRAGLWYEFCFRQNIPLVYDRRSLTDGVDVLEASIHGDNVLGEVISQQRLKIEEGIRIWEQVGSPLGPSSKLYDELVVREWQPVDWEEIA